MKKYLNREFFFANKEKIICVLIALALIVSGIVYNTAKKPDADEFTDSGGSEKVSQTKTDDERDIIIVDVSGAVNDPRVVELDKGDRVNDAIEAAGGLTADADISSLNRAAVLKDGDKIFVPEKGSGRSGSVTNANSGTGSGGSAIADGRVNINMADKTELQTLPGVGPAIADRIIAYRESHGNFSRPEDIKNVSGIGDKTYEKMKNSITV
ncbi:MAG: helix-hairpin-helix domain-containing protein [Anaerovoracaceae bacterium]|nr:helix-hairpin-helix domain-containing protein [Anaerovoracaceae bacterium]